MSSEAHELEAGRPTHETATEWLDLHWSAWMPLIAAHPLALAQLPAQPGLYRIRRADRPHQLEWIGWAGHGVRETVERLSRQVHLPVEPFDDPRTPAAALWSVRRRTLTTFEVSGAALPLPDATGVDRARQLRQTHCESSNGLDGQEDG